MHSTDFIALFKVRQMICVQAAGFQSKVSGLVFFAQPLSTSLTLLCLFVCVFAG